jgi:hypothetical protein
MSKYNLCVIDDKIPVDQYINKVEVDSTNLIDQNIFTNYLKFADEEIWEDTNLYYLIKSFKEQKVFDLNIYGFKSHSFYLNYINENLFSPDVIIFDCDIGISDKSSDESLMEILEKTYCLIAIFSGCDMINNIQIVINEERFKPFNYRLFIVDKNEQNSALNVINKIEKHLSEFSYEYGRDFKHVLITAINKTFCRIGKLSFNQLIKMFGYLDEKENKYKISSFDFIEIMFEQIKAHLMSSRSVEQLTAEDDSLSDVLLNEKQLWHYRMFHEPLDNIVRKGDIVRHKNNDRYYLIISSDCHLNDFWKKNLGFIVAVPVYKADDPAIQKKLKNYRKNSNLNNFKLSSLVNPLPGAGITLLPHMDKENDYIILLKAVETFEVENPDYNKEETYKLKYDEISYFDGEHRYRLNEPFLSALIELFLRSISDIGVPDYSKQIINTLENHIKVLGSGEKKNGK